VAEASPAECHKTDFRKGQRVRCTSGPHRREEGTVAAVLIAGVEVEFDTGERKWCFRTDLELVAELT
jgi:hypothetical protein